MTAPPELDDERPDSRESKKINKMK